MTDEPILYAHRGTNPYTDNEYDSYKWAFKYGADYVETDFRLTKDGYLVSYHDDFGVGIANMTLAEVRAVVPGVVTLEQLITLTKEMEIETGRKLGILIETKSTDLATHEAVFQTLIDNDFVDPERIVIQSFGNNLAEVRETLMPKYAEQNPAISDLPLVYLASDLPAEYLDYWASHLDGIAPQMALITPESVAAAQAHGLVINGWTVEGTYADVQNALRLGVDGIINDNTQLSRPALEKLVNNADVSYGTDQWDVINGGAGKDVVYAMSGDDIVRAGDSDDVLYGDAGNDLLFGGAGNDQLVGGSGNDFLAGGEGADVLFGGAGNDVIVATGDQVVFRAGNGIDLVSLDSTSTIVFDGITPASVTVLRDGNNLIIRSGSDVLVLLDGVDPAHQPASITTADGFTLTGAQLAALAVEGTDAEVAALLPALETVLANAPAFAAPSTVAIGTDLVANDGIGNGHLVEHVENAEAGAVYRLSFSLADLPTGDDGVRVLWNGEVIYQGTPAAAGSNLHFIVTGGSGDGSNELVFEGAGQSFGATLDNVHLVKVADPVLPAPGNVAPVASDTDLLISQNIPFNGKVVATDADNDVLTYSLGEGPAHGTLIFNTNGTYTYTPTAEFIGADGFTYLVNDGHGGVTEAAVNLTIGEGIVLGTDLIVNGSFEDLSESSGNNGPGDWGYRNPDGQIVGWTNVNNKRIEQHWDNYGGVVAKDGRIWIDMDHSQTGTTVDRIGQSIEHVETGATYRVSFSLSDSDTIRYDDGVRVLWNGEVIFDGAPPQTGTSWTTLSFDVVGGSGDGSNRLEFIDTGVSDSWGAGAALDDVHFVKIANVGDILPENHTPIAVDGHAEGLKNTVITGELTASDQDAGSSLIYSLGTGPAHGTVQVYTDGTYRYTPTAGFTGEDSFTYLVNDGHGGKDTATYSLTVTSSSSQVAIGTDLIINGSFEDISESSGNNGPSDWGYRNPDGQILGWTNVNNKRIEQHYDNYGGVIAKDGRFWIDLDSSGSAARHRIGQTITEAETGATYRVSFSLSDSDTARYDDGVRVLWNGQVIFEGQPPQTSSGWATLSFDVVGGSGDGSNRLEFIDTGVADSWGAGVALDDVHFVKIANAGDTLPTNHAPTAVNGHAEGLLNTLVTGQVSASDQDAGASLIFSLKQGASHGTVLVYTDGTYRYTPTTGFTGEDNFTVLVNDGHGGTTEATVGLTIRPPNTLPVTVADEGHVSEHDTATFDLVHNDTDVEDGTPHLTGFTVTGVDGVNVGLDAATSAFHIVDGQLVFTGGDIFGALNDGEHATVTINYTAADNDGGQSVGQFVLTIDGQTDRHPITGTNGADVLSDTTGADHISAGAGNDIIFSSFGDDIIDAGTGNDTVMTQTGDKIVNGGDGNDTINGGTGASVLNGDAGNDSIIGGLGNETINGGDGNDTLIGGAGQNVISGGEGNDSLFGGVGDSVLNGDAGNDTINGGLGNETIDGGAGNDMLLGGAGNDVIRGGAGNDQMFGGLGSDTIVFKTGDGHDTVFDFQAQGTGHDVIELDHNVFADFDALMASGALHDTAGGVDIAYADGSTLTLTGVTKASLKVDDFHFA
ncbi:Ca2+-binding RTX toxin-like protein [Nitrobacteraceae bacterium AZCC 1564]